MEYVNFGSKGGSYYVRGPPADATYCSVCGESLRWYYDAYRCTYCYFGTHEACREVRGDASVCLDCVRGED